MKFPMYFVDENGVIHTVYSETESTYTNHFNIANRPYGYDVEILFQDGGELCIDQEYCLWDSLVELASVIERE